MNLVKCKNGHYYDGDKFETCPHCSGAAEPNDHHEDETMSLDWGKTNTHEDKPEVNPTEPLTEPKAAATGIIYEDAEKTIGFYQEEVGIEPVVGWLVCVEGSELGRSFNLKTGKNFVGRNSKVNDIVINGDASVSREKHAIVIYDPKSRNFLVQPGMSSELFYLNDEVVLQAAVIKDKDMISVGNTKLMFVPCCGPDFTWDDYKKKEEK